MARRLLLLGALVAVLVIAVGALLYFRERAAAPSATSTTADWYDVYFTDPKYPDRPQNRHGGIDEKFVAFLDTAQRSLDVAIYDFDLENAADALVRAKDRGVTVRMVMDSDTLNNTKDAAVQRAVGTVQQAGIPIVGDNRQPIMHHKFVVRDGEEVWTGSWNFTTGDTYRLNNNAVRIRSRELADNYAAEFRKMFEAKQFGPNKPKGVPHPVITIGGARIETYFSAQDNVASHVAARVREAQHSIRFLAFSFTQDDIGQAVIQRQQAGAAVSGVFERTGSQTRFSEYGKMKQAGLDVYQDGNPYTMHHKVFILDDATTLFGSFNFSDGANRDNDENLLIVDDPGFAQAFIQEFDRVLAVAKSPAPVRATPRKQRPR
ncbi:MAG TPA: phospholipase D-like domain-containing protein [Chloroflexota bacterium]|nr:phospholipase D-like domain-containing protein [Chloroflexota bacterium]